MSNFMCFFAWRGYTHHTWNSCGGVRWSLDRSSRLKELGTPRPSIMSAHPRQHSTIYQQIDHHQLFFISLLVRIHHISITFVPGNPGNGSMTTRAQSMSERSVTWSVGAQHLGLQVTLRAGQRLGGAPIGATPGSTRKGPDHPKVHGAGIRMRTGCFQNPVKLEFRHVWNSRDSLGGLAGSAAQGALLVTSALRSAPLGTVGARCWGEARCCFTDCSDLLELRVGAFTVIQPSTSIHRPIQSTDFGSCDG